MKKNFKICKNFGFIFVFTDLEGNIFIALLYTC